jgi:RNA recognition motif-containing protein
MNIYVGNLSYEVTVEDLHKAFEAFGQVESVNIIKDKFSGRSKGFGFVEMPDKANAQSEVLTLMRLALAPNAAVAEEDMVVADKVVGEDSSKRHSDVIKP